MDVFHSSGLPFWRSAKSTRAFIGCRVTGNVVNLMTYGAFVRIDEGIEGLVEAVVVVVDTSLVRAS